MAEHLKLYRRVTRFKALPAPGGIDQQDERTMMILDVIGDEVDAAERRRQAREADRAKSKRGGILGRFRGR